MQRAWWTMLPAWLRMLGMCMSCPETEQWRRSTCMRSVTDRLQTCLLLDSDVVRLPLEAETEQWRPSKCIGSVAKQNACCLIIQTCIICLETEQWRQSTCSVNYWLLPFQGINLKLSNDANTQHTCILSKDSPLHFSNVKPSCSHVLTTSQAAQPSPQGCQSWNHSS